VPRGWLSWGPVVLAGAMAAILVASQVISVLDVQRAAANLERGQAETVLSAVRADLRTGDRNEERLREIYERYRGDGLRYVGLFGYPGHLAIGQPLATVSRPPSPGEVEEVGARLRLAQPLPVSDAPRPPLRHPPTVVIEVEPSLGAQLAAAAQRTLIIGLVASVVALGLSLALRRLLRQRSEMERAAERDRHLAALGQMSAVLAHEIRNPLASLKGHAQLLQEVLPEGKQADKAGRVVHEARRLEALTNNLLDFVKTGRPRRSEVDPREVVRAAAVEVGEDRFAVFDEGAPPTFPLDRNAMGRALTNVMRNAAQAAEGTIDVTVSRDGRDGLSFVVRDRGPGVAEDMLDRVFEAFETTRTRGTGLGLAVARRVVEGHDGSVEAANHPDGGAQFTLRVRRGAS